MPIFRIDRGSIEARQALDSFLQQFCIQCASHIFAAKKVFCALEDIHPWLLIIGGVCATAVAGEITVWGNHPVFNQQVC